MAQFERHCLTASLQYIGNVPEYLRTDCSVIRQDLVLEDIPVAWLAVNCGDE
jgi:hypothetical protein